MATNVETFIDINIRKKDTATDRIDNNSLDVLSKINIKPKINKQKSDTIIHSIPYKDASNNINDVIKSVFVKECRPNLLKEFGNDNYYTATDRFSKTIHDKEMEILSNITDTKDNNS